MKVSTAHQLFIHELKDAYSAEKQLIKALPKIAKQAQHPDLKAALEEHLKETEGQAERLERIFEIIDHKPQAHLCQAIQGILAEGEEGMEKADPAIIDLMIAGSAQRVEHYEKAVYTGLHEMASFMKHEKVAGLLKETLDEEVAASKKVASISKILLKSVPIGHEVK
ncbi:MAG: hypothetical protein K0S20_209 [Patescibacteria group bacterium]|nr:hypothetical protein [Patescibacteria group bacterium]